MNLRGIRTARKLSVPRLAELSGVPRRTIQDIEKRGDCLISTALKLAEALEVTLDELCETKREGE
ncbi:MAG: helix-turn-helix domain-containing protein [Clostridiales bacterium]|jgi:transcriptional regulator with XRE-family HTH domain|nr:helix-turn-helix domain-containing protein [Clostridiales bacterium]